MREISAGGMVYRLTPSGMQWLMIEDRFGKISIPKGKQESDETLEQTALREIHEETGLKGQLRKQLLQVSYRYDHHQHGEVEKEVTYYLVQAVSEQITVQVEEVNRVWWVSEREALQMHKEHGYDNNLPVIDKAMETLQQMLKLAAYIDHTLLKPEATYEQIQDLCAEARLYQFASVCVNARWVELCRRELDNSSVKVCAVVGFPLGAMTSQSKATETAQAIEQGATEIDMVLSVGDLKSAYGQNKAARLDQVKEDIEAVVQSADGQAVVKVIIETVLLTEEEKVLACQISERAGAHFVKTSTGFNGGGANVADVHLMKETVGKRMSIKASGGIRDQQVALAMIEAGAERIGASSGIAIVLGTDEAILSVE